MMKDVLKNYDEENVGDYLPFVLDIEQQLRVADEQRTMEVDAIDTRISEAQGGVAPGTTGPADGEGSGGPSESEGPGPGSGPSPGEAVSQSNDYSDEPI
jgi:hypothetical protein